MSSDRSTKAPVRVGTLLGAGRLGDLVREAERRRGFTGRIRAKLPPDEGEHLVSAAENDAGELVLVMDSPAWAARVRYRAAELGVRRLRVKVRPDGAGGVGGAGAAGRARGASKPE